MPLLWTGLTVLGAFLFLTVVFRPLEVLFPARAAQRFFRPSWRLDLCFFLGQYLLPAFVLGFPLTTLAGLIGGPPRRGCAPPRQQPRLRPRRRRSRPRR